MAYLNKCKWFCLGDVRGIGLFVGIDLVRDRESRKPATAEAQHIIARMKEECILLSADGPYCNILKIKPPLVFNQDNADRLVSVLDEVLTELRDSKVIHISHIFTTIIPCFPKWFTFDFSPQLVGSEEQEAEESSSPTTERKEFTGLKEEPNGKKKKLIEGVESVKI